MSKRGSSSFVSADEPDSSVSAETYPRPTFSKRAGGGALPRGDLASEFVRPAAFVTTVKFSATQSIFNGTSKTNFKSDSVVKLVLYLQRMGRGLQMCPKSLLMVISF